MKLKKILLEEKKVDELNKLLKNEFVVYEGPVFRGSNDDIDRYKVLTPRKNRNPLNTDQATQNMVSAVNDNFYPEFPNRRRSKFGTTKISYARSYGTPYYVFPHENSKVRFYEKDTYSKLGEINDWLYDSFNYARRVSEENIESVKDEYGKSLFNLISGLKNFYSDVKLSIGQFMGSFKGFNTLDELIERLIEIRNKTKSDLENTVHYFTKFLKEVKKYFKNGQKEYMKDAGEVIIEGDYLMVNTDFFDRNRSKLITSY